MDDITEVAHDLLRWWYNPLAAANKAMDEWDEFLEEVAK